METQLAGAEARLQLLEHERAERKKLTGYVTVAASFASHLLHKLTFGRWKGH